MKLSDPEAKAIFPLTIRQVRKIRHQCEKILERCRIESRPRPRSVARCLSLIATIDAIGERCSIERQWLVEAAAHRWLDTLPKHPCVHGRLEADTARALGRYVPIDDVVGIITERTRP